MLGAFNFVLLVAGGFIYSGGFLGITGYGYGWDKTRTGLLVLLAALILYAWRHMVQDKSRCAGGGSVPRTPEEGAGAPRSCRSRSGAGAGATGLGGRPTRLLGAQVPARQAGDRRRGSARGAAGGGSTNQAIRATGMQEGDRRTRCRSSVKRTASPATISAVDDRRGAVPQLDAGGSAA